MIIYDWNDHTFRVASGEGVSRNEVAVAYLIFTGYQMARYRRGWDPASRWEFSPGPDRTATTWWTPEQVATAVTDMLLDKVENA